MPGIVNKIIINNDRLHRDTNSIEGELGNLNTLGNEAKEAGMLIKDTFDLRDELEKSCEEHTAANRKHLDDLRAIEKKFRLRIDDFLANKP